VRPLLGFGLLVGLVILFVAFEFIYVVYNGTTVNAPAIPRDTSSYGTSGSPLKFVVIGDSTSIGQGAPYPESIGPKAAQHIAQTHQVSYTNFGISGATAQTLVDRQLAKAVALKPDVVLIAIGANDATHLTKSASLRQSMNHITDSLISANCNVKIVLTGSPAMGSVKRFAWPLKQYMGLRQRQVNSAFTPIIASKQLTLAPVAAKTGKLFREHPEYFAADNFHPNAAGYAAWVPVINTALDQALANQPSHCQT
jgi:lysophospholipase L1-like esterase